MKIRTCILTSLTVIVTFALIRIFNLAYPVEITTTSRASELSVVGEGKVEVVPDVAYVDAGINVVGSPTVDAARQTVDQTNNAIIQSLQGLGIDKKDIKTSNYSINPNYSYENNQNELDGYNASANITIKVRTVDTVPQVIQAVTTAGANQVNGARFDVENPQKYREQARAEAIKNAREQAQKLAKDLGIRIGKVTNIVEGSSGSPIPLFTANKMADSFGGGAPVVEPGSQTITSVVTLFFDKK